MIEEAKEMKSKFSDKISLKVTMNALKVNVNMKIIVISIFIVKKQPSLKYAIGTLFKDEKKIMPALKVFEKAHNLYDFRDRLRGYLGLPRRRSSISKHRK